MNEEMELVAERLRQALHAATDHLTDMARVMKRLDADKALLLNQLDEARRQLREALK